MDYRSTCFETLLLTIDLDRIAQMSCNPSIGGLGKGHIVREIDALGGIMAKAIDATGIHYKMLGKSRGPAVHGPRAQADKKAYHQYVKKNIGRTSKNISTSGKCREVVVEGDKIRGVVGLSGITYWAKAVVLTTGTFMQGLIHIGLKNYKGGRFAEPASYGISNSLIDLGIHLERLKTGTPPRLHGATIDYKLCEIQEPDDPPKPFSFETKKLDRPRIPCYITYTNDKTHDIIRNNLDRSPLYAGVIKSIGPRYCPSIEDKVMKFPHRDRHQLFLEPEGVDTKEIYANGIPTSLPYDVQDKFVHSIQGLEKAKIMRFGYAIEYDYIPPTQIQATLETKKIQNLYAAGQINGTTGYEEAGAQGLMAGINAAQKLMGKSSFILRRDQAYIGVLIDDLVTRGTSEPYRMFTSRAEYRLLLRQDNADRRLRGLAYELGTVNKSLYDDILQKEARIEELKKTLEKLRHSNQPLVKILRRPEMDWLQLVELDSRLEEWNAYPDVCEQVEIDVKYEGYMQRQEKQIKKFRQMENFRIPEGIDYNEVNHLRRESKEKLSRHRPLSLGQASRIEGVSPADISVLMIHLEALRKKHSQIT